MSDECCRPDPSPISDDATGASQAHRPPTDGQAKPETMKDRTSEEKDAPDNATADHDDYDSHGLVTDGGALREGGHDNVPLTPPEVALMHVLRGCNLPHEEIGARLGIAPKTVSEYLRDSREAVRDGADPMAVFWDAVSVPEPAEAGLVADGGASE